ncbi:hypothetical protein AURANDRAFT_67716 [Aureococcus anophagefferens]|uniref:PARP-type domain-containing protein n=1 Tax=Aureococcus anophagefferens TaxID=44056 RepID=F0YM55_AURAN|nr:hypothetical protein AURANDRAFT_67716 [Aureococcus anophagefferens]EGB03824.1 hypothetical protein AURANDRAFT_67716 [Aureococcus anophagefferens]|eukprot:XP_009041482.1 hypothetical protein AURANDRAFT_67716 [Aureococcus anophagefferens]
MPSFSSGDRFDNIDDMDPSYEASIANNSRSKCRERSCRCAIARGTPRIGRKMKCSKTSWYHVECIFEQFLRGSWQRKTITTLNDVKNIHVLTLEQKLESFQRQLTNFGFKKNYAESSTDVCVLHKRGHARVAQGSHGDMTRDITMSTGDTSCAFITESQDSTNECIIAAKFKSVAIENQRRHHDLPFGPTVDDVNRNSRGNFFNEFLTRFVSERLIVYVFVSVAPFFGSTVKVEFSKSIKLNPSLSLSSKVTLPKSSLTIIFDGTVTLLLSSGASSLNVTLIVLVKLLDGVVNELTVFLREKKMIEKEKREDIRDDEPHFRQGTETYDTQPVFNERNLFAKIYKLKRQTNKYKDLFLKYFDLPYFDRPVFDHMELYETTDNHAFMLISVYCPSENSKGYYEAFKLHEYKADLYSSGMGCVSYILQLNVGEFEFYKIFYIVWHTFTSNPFGGVFKTYPFLTISQPRDKRPVVVITIFFIIDKQVLERFTTRMDRLSVRRNVFAQFNGESVHFVVFYYNCLIIDYLLIFYTAIALQKQLPN